MLEAAYDRFREDIDVSESLTEDRNAEILDGTITAKFGEAILQNGGPIESDRSEADDVYVKLRDDSQAEENPEILQERKKSRGIESEMNVTLRNPWRIIHIYCICG